MAEDASEILFFRNHPLVMKPLEEKSAPFDVYMSDSD